MDDISYANGHPYQNFDVSKLLKASRKNGVKFNVIVNNCKGGINSCDIPFTEDIAKFIDSYKTLTRTAALECKSSFLEDYMIVGTSAMVQTELDCIVNQYTDKFCNPMVMWGKYCKRCFKTTLPISFQFHHVQMDGGHGAMFLELLQREIRNCCCTLQVSDYLHEE